MPTNLTLQECRLEETNTRNALQAFKARNNILYNKLNAEIAKMHKEWNNGTGTPSHARKIHDIQKRIREHQEYVTVAEENLRRVCEGARVLREQTERALKNDFIYWSPDEVVNNFLSGEMNYEVLRSIYGVGMLRAAFQQKGRQIPSISIVRTVVEDIVARKYHRPDQGRFWNEWVASINETSGNDTSNL